MYTKQNEKLKNLITLTEHNLGYSIFQSIEKTKIELSRASQSTFAYSNSGIEIEANISLEEYDGIIQKDIDKIKSYLDEFMTAHEIHADDVDSLFLTGGTSMVTAVQHIFQEKFPSSNITSGDNFISVAKGLAYCGYLFEE